MPRIGSGLPDDLDREEGHLQLPRVRDVLVVPAPGQHADPAAWDENPPLDGPVDLGNGVHLERLRGDDIELAAQVIEASIPRGLNFDATRPFGQLYSFWREVPEAEWNAEGETMFAWDPSEAISEAIVVSRLVRDNAHGFEFVGRVIDTDALRRIAPRLGHDGRSAYRPRKDRFWFTDAEAAALRTLLDRYRAVKDALPDRVKRALYEAEMSARSRYITDAVVRITTGLEALLNTGEETQVTARFVSRSKQLMVELGLGKTSNAYWKWLYAARSHVVHGAESKLVAPVGWDATEGDPPPDVAKIAKAQEVLRTAIRRAIEDDTFRSVFDNTETVRDHYPFAETEARR